ncbi:9353_t:CDS:2 [Ambispora gerdemannii]|uniref:9353_t:CDS:1 n=1 Tax=Ambispora gerdemannii TaxID=144530 RepID=A0A9N8Z1P7_9GLOM|nr:9353_t:CDS:2 [Ambispora gerdemannii]
MTPTTGSSPTSNIKHNYKAYFTFEPGYQTFQQGYLGVCRSFIAGAFHLRFTNGSPLPVKEIRLSFVGMERVKWREEAGALQTTYKAEKQLVYLTSCIWSSNNNSGSNKEYESVTTLDLPFHFALPGDLPASMELPKGRGKISYTLKVVISRQPKILRFRASKKQYVEVNCPIIRYYPSRLPDPTRWVQCDDKRAVARGVGYDVSLEQTTFRPEGMIIIPLRLVFHKSQAYLKKLTVGIKEYRECRAADGKFKQKKYIMETKFTGDQVPELPGQTNQRFTIIKTFVPTKDKIFYSLDTDHISIALDICEDENALRTEELLALRSPRFFLQEQRHSQHSLLSIASYESRISTDQRSIRSSSRYNNSNNDHRQSMTDLSSSLHDSSDYTQPSQDSSSSRHYIDHSRGSIDSSSHALLKNKSPPPPYSPSAPDIKITIL